MQHLATLHRCYESSKMAEQGEDREMKTREEEDPLARIEFENELRATLKEGDVDEITENLTPRALVRCNTNTLLMAMEVNFQLRRLADKKGPDEDEFTKMANSVDEFTNCLLEPLKSDTENRHAFGDSLDDIIDAGIELEQKKLFAHPVMYNLMKRKWWGIFGEMSRCSWLELSYWAWLVLNIWCLFDIFLFPVLFAVFYIKHHMNLNKEMDLAFVLNATSKSANDAFTLMKESIKYLMGKHNYRRVKYQILIHGEDSCSTEISFSSDFHSMKDLLDSADQLTRNPDVDIPALHEDLQKVAWAFEQVEKRPNSQTVLVLFTDHKTCLRHEKDDVEEQVKRIKEMGIKIVPVGIGPNVDSKELKRINNGRKVLLFGQNANRADVGKKIWQELHGKDLFESYQEYFTTPYFVFIRDTLSYLALLGLHFAFCLQKSSIQFSGLEWAILVFFLGRILMECRQFLSLKLQPESRMTTKYKKGSKYQICDENERSKTKMNQSKADGVFLQRFRKYLSDRWNILDLMTLLIYTVTFFLRVVTWAVSNSVTDNRALVISGYLYGLNTMFLTLRAFGQVMETVKSIGVIQIALFHIIGNVATIFFQFIATILAFSIAITKVYMAERSFVSDNTMKEPACKSSDGLACWWTMVKLLTWSLLGIIELDPFESVDSASVTLIHFLFGAFLVMGVILLVNMMIALLSNTYQRVEDNALKEWSFKKAITIQTYSSYHPIPVPLNLVSHLVLCIRCLRQICARKCTGIPIRNTRRIKTRNTSLDEVVEKLQRMYIETYGYSFPLTDERKIDHILKETERNRQMANQIAYRTFASRGVDEDIYPTGPKAWQSKGIRVHGCLLTYEGSESCLQCRDDPVKYHGARYLFPFSPETPHFEVLIQETGERRLLSVGVVGKDYGNHAPPGWFKGTVGYHVDDGKIFDAANYKKGVEYGGEAIAHRGDLIGCTVRFDLAKGGKVPVVFTLNGKQITSHEKWTEYTPYKKSLYPYICMAHTGITVLAKMCTNLKTDEGLKSLKTNADGRTHENGRIHEDERIQQDDRQLFGEQLDTELAILEALEEMDEDFQSKFQEIDRNIKTTQGEMVTGHDNFKRLVNGVLHDFKRFEKEIQDDIAKAKGYSRDKWMGSGGVSHASMAADRAECMSLQYLCETDIGRPTNLELIKKKTINLQRMTRKKFSAIIEALYQFRRHSAGNAERQTELMENVKTRFHVHEKFIRTSLPITKDAVLVSTE